MKQNHLLWQVISKAAGAIALTLLSFAIDSLRDIASELGELKVQLTQISTIISVHSSLLDKHDQRLDRLEQPRVRNRLTP